MSPVGVFYVDATGIVRTRVSVVAGASGCSREVGRSFFEEIAPCTNCAEFRGRFETLVARGGGAERFAFRLRCPWYSAALDVRMIGTSNRGAWLLIADPALCPNDGRLAGAVDLALQPSPA